MIDLEIDFEQSIAQATRELDQADKRVTLAIKRAVRKAVSWLSREASVAAAATGGVKPAALKRAGRVRIRTGDGESLVWIGLDPMPAHTAKSSWSKDSAGATVNGKLLAGTFRAAIYSGERKIWIRSRRNREFGHVLANTRRKYKAPPSALDRGRLPVDLVGVELGKPDELDQRLAPRAQERFEALLIQELNYAFNHEKR